MVKKYQLALARLFKYIVPEHYLQVVVVMQLQYIPNNK